MSVATGSIPDDSVESRRRSVFSSSIVGIGAVTGFGWGIKHLWDGFLLGKSSVKRVTGLDGFVDGGEAYLSLVADEGDRRRTESLRASRQVRRARSRVRRNRPRMAARAGGGTCPQHRSR